jgi:hypothetical protein
MSFNGSGTFLINTAGQPVVSGTVISSTAFNALTADLATGLSTVITKDGQTTVTANIPMSTYKFTGLGVGSAATDSANLSQVQSTVTKLLTSVSGADTITAVGAPVVAAYAAGQMFYFVATGDNTGAVTLNIDSLGAKAVTRDGSVALAAGDIKSGEVVVVVYDGTRFQVVSQLNSAGNATFANVSITSALNVGGVATFSAGTAAAPAITTTGDTNTGIFFPAADTIAFTEGGTESFRVNSSGNMGIGTTTPAGKLDVNGNGLFSGTLTATLPSSVGAIVARNSSTTASELAVRPASGKSGWLSFTEETVADRWIVGIKNGNGGLFFNTGNPSSNTDKMVLDSSGNLGIGTSSPSSKLEVLNGGDSIVTITGNTASGNFASVDFKRNTGTVNAAVRSQSVGGNDIGEMYFMTRPSAGSLTERMRLDSSGNLGLGVTPSAVSVGDRVVQVRNFLFNDNTNGYGILRYNNFFNGTNDVYLNTGAVSAFQMQGNAFKWYQAASGTAGNTISFTQAMTLDADGRLALGATGILGTSNRASFTNTTSAKGVLALQNTSVSGYSAIELYDNSGSQQGAMGWGNASVSVTGAASATYLYSTGPITFLSGGTTERARITSGGDFGIGNSNPLYRLTVNKDTTSALGFFTNSNNSTPNGISIDFSAASPDNNTQYFLYCEDSTTARVILYSDGDGQNHDNSWGGISDERLKQDIVDANSQWDDIKNLRVRKYRFKSDVENGKEHAQIGLIAQEVMPVSPGLVIGSEDTQYGVQYSILYMKAVKALQEAMARIEQLEAKVATLESK